MGQKARLIFEVVVRFWRVGGRMGWVGGGCGCGGAVGAEGLVGAGDEGGDEGGGGERVWWMEVRRCWRKTERVEQMIRVVGMVWWARM